MVNALPCPAAFWHSAMMKKNGNRINIPKEGSSKSADWCYPSEWRRSAALFLDLAFIIATYAFFVHLTSIIVRAVTDSSVLFVIHLFALFILVFWGYFACLESSPLQATLGKGICGLIVVDLKGYRLTFREASDRFWANFVNWLVLVINPIGFFSAIFLAGSAYDAEDPSDTLVLQRNSPDF
jgi:uncharacterized RDD family membrane protein YckC